MSTEAKINTERLHQLLADTSGLTNAELRRQLQLEGVDVSAFLQRMSALAPVDGPVAPAATAPVVPFPISTECEMQLAARQADQRRATRSE